MPSIRNLGHGGTLPLACRARVSGGFSLAPVRRRQYSTSTQSRFFNIQIQASWGNGQSNSSGQGGEAYADSQPKWGGFLNSSSSSSGGASGSSSSSDSPITRLLTAAVDHVRAAPLPGAAAPSLALPLLPVVLWCVGWVFTSGMFTLAQTSLSGMCSVAQALYPSIPLRGASYEDIAVSLVKALQSGTDNPSTWMRPGLWAPAWLLRWLMATLYGLATAGTSVAGTLMHSNEVLAVTGICRGLLYASCLLFMLPLGSGLNSMASGLLQRWKDLKASAAQPSSSSSSSGGSGGYGSGLDSSGVAAVGSSSSGKDGSITRLSDTSALALKLAGVLAWPCISAAAVLQPSLLLQAQTGTTPLAIAAPQVFICACLLSLLLAIAVAAGRFGWDVARQQADDDTVVDFGLQLGMLCGLQAGLNVVQLGLCVAGKQLQPSQLGMPFLSTLILCRIVCSTWRLWRMEAGAPSVWLQVLTLTPAAATPSTPGGGSSNSSSSSSGYSR